jgi:hypothetical protein
VRERSGAQRLLVFIALALLLWSAASAPAASHVDLDVPVLVFCFLVVLRVALFERAADGCAVQLTALLELHTSRAPPLA